MATEIENARGQRLICEFNEGTGPGVMFLPGFKSNRLGTKALFLAELCRQRETPFLTLDYSGHGDSEGDFAHGNISDWLQDAVDALRQLGQGRHWVLVGSSMGAWVSLLLASRLQDLVSGMLTIAAAPDFTERLIWERLPEEIQAKLQRGEAWHRPSEYDDGSPYPITYQLIEDGRQHLILSQPIALDFPLRALHGLADFDVPWHQSLQMIEQWHGEDARLELIKGGDHRLCEPAHLRLISQRLDELLALG
ncbi:MAG: alpha/beta hydrolase [Granulosicoccaceae bacterium]